MMASVVSRCCRFWQKASVLTPRLRCVLRAPAAGYAKKIGGGSAKMVANVSQKVELDVEADPERLVKFCCGANIYTTGQDPELKPDSEYPEWLWTLRTERHAPDLSELDPNTFQYWGRLRKMHRKRVSQLMRAKKIK